ncbi:hypothetical protein [Vibrio paucivorans]
MHGLTRKKSMYDMDDIIANHFIDEAIRVQNRNVNRSYALMKQAQKYKPDFPFIERKLQEYKRILTR